MNYSVPVPNNCHRIRIMYIGSGRLNLAEMGALLAILCTTTVQYICSSSTLEIIMMNLGEEVLEAESLGGDFADSAAYRIKSLNPPIPVDQVSSGP